jgi:hypothetical protein
VTPAIPASSLALSAHQHRQDVGAARIGHQLGDLGKLRGNDRHGSSAQR